MSDFDLLESMLRCNTVEELHVLTTNVVKKMGFEHFIYGVIVNVSLTHPYRFIFNGYPKGWWEHYTASNYIKSDPVVHHCEKNIIPVVWHQQVVNEKQAEKVMCEAKEFGLANGASYPVHGRRGELGILSLTVSHNSNEAKRDIVAAMGASQLLACYLHESIQRIVLSKGPLPLANMDLTEREKECLLWASEGKTGGEIADILNISERTVTFHLQNAGQKLGTCNRQHAVSRALTLGLIAP